MLDVERMSSTRCLYTQASPFNLCRRTPTTSGLCSRHTSNSNAMVTFPKSPWVRHLRVYLQRRSKETIRTGLMDRPPNQQRYHFFFLPFLCEIYIFLRQDGEDLVKDLVWVGLTGQSNIVLCLVEKIRTKLFRIWCVVTEQVKSSLCSPWSCAGRHAELVSCWEWACWSSYPGLSPKNQTFFLLASSSRCLLLQPCPEIET